jgi:hypothetical protein
MHDLYNLKEMLCEELENYGKSRELSPASLQMIDTLAHACKNICKIIESKEESGYSRRASYDDGYSGDGYYYDDGGMSHRRGRAANGRFVSRDASEMSHRLRDMADKATDEHTRREMERLADKMERM